MSSRALASAVEGMLSRSSSSSAQRQGSMQMQRRCLHSSGWRRKTCKVAGESSVNGLSVRRYAATAMMSRRPEAMHASEALIDEEDDRPSSSSASCSQPSRSSSSDLSKASLSSSSTIAGNKESLRATGAETTTLSFMRKREQGDAAKLKSYLRELLPPLDFPDTVARQMLTHISAQEAWAGHNARLAFIGRRAMNTYTLLFLQSAVQELVKSGRASEASFDFDQIAYRTMHTHHIGQFVGTKWNLLDAMLWTPLPSVGRGRTAGTGVVETWTSEGKEGNAEGKPDVLGSIPRSPGLYKIQGTTVEGIMGGVFHQFGGKVAQQVFHTRLLPNILCPNTPFGLHDSFHEAALKMQERMGGANALLLPKESFSPSAEGSAFPSIQS